MTCYRHSYRRKVNHPLRNGYVHRRAYSQWWLPATLDHHVYRWVQTATGQHNLFDHPYQPGALHRLAEQPLVVGQQHGPAATRQHPGDLGERRRVERLVDPVRTDALAEREVRDYAVCRTGTQRKVGRVGPDQGAWAAGDACGAGYSRRSAAAAGQVLRGHPQPPRLRVEADEPAGPGHLGGVHEQRAGPAERVNDELTRFDLGEPDHDRGDHRIRGGGGTQQLAEALGEEQRADLHRARLDVDVPRLRGVDPAVVGDQPVASRPAVLAQLADPEPDRAVGQQGGQHAVLQRIVQRVGLDREDVEVPDLRERPQRAAVLDDQPVRLPSQHPRAQGL